MQSELAKKLKTVLDNMSQEQFDQDWSKIVSYGFPNVLILKQHGENFSREEIQQLFEKLVVRGCFKTDRDYNIAKQTLLELTGIDYENNL